MANTDWFHIDIEGVSAHGSMPHKGVDAVVVGAEMVNGLQVLVSRDVSPFDPVVVTVASSTVARRATLWLATPTFRERCVPGPKSYAAKFPIASSAS